MGSARSTGYGGYNPHAAAQAKYGGKSRTQSTGGGGYPYPPSGATQASSGAAAMARRKAAQASQSAANYPSQPPPPPPQPPAQVPYQPHSPAASELAGAMGEYGQGLLDPNSPEARRMQEVLTARIGGETEASKRLASFQASQAGMGAGESPELMAMMGDIDIAGMEAGADAASGMMTQLPQLGLGFMQGGLQGELGISGQDLEAWLGQQRINQQQYGADMESYYRGQQMDLERERLRQQAEMNQFSMMFG